MLSGIKYGAICITYSNLILEAFSNFVISPKTTFAKQMFYKALSFLLSQPKSKVHDQHMVL